MFYTPLKLGKIISESELEAIFSNIEHIYEFNKELYKELIVESQKTIEERKFGTLMLSKLSKLQIYTVYCADMPHSRNMVHTLFEENKEFANFLIVPSFPPFFGV